MFITFAECET